MNLLDILETNIKLCKDNDWVKCGIYVSNEHNRKLLAELFKKISHIEIPNINFKITQQEIMMLSIMVVILKL